MVGTQSVGVSLGGCDNQWVSGGGCVSECVRLSVGVSVSGCVSEGVRLSLGVSIGGCGG